MQGLVKHDVIKEERDLQKLKNQLAEIERRKEIELRKKAAEKESEQIRNRIKAYGETPCA